RIQKCRESLGVSVGPSKIAEAARLIAERNAAEEALRIRRKKTIDDRKLGAREAKERLQLIRQKLFESISSEIGDLAVDASDGILEVGKARLSFSSERVPF
ncbi:MAG: hypothetical protein ACAI37_03970, partial [Chthoniobacter sp.]